MVLGKSHGFRATDATCARCHEQVTTRDPSLQARARALLSRLQEAPWADRPPHARLSDTRVATTLARGIDQATRSRALYDVLLVIEDGAADVHHPTYASALLDAAERALEEPKP